MIRGGSLSSKSALGRRGNRTRRGVKPVLVKSSVWNARERPPTPQPRQDWREVLQRIRERLS